MKYVFIITFLAILITFGCLQNEQKKLNAKNANNAEAKHFLLKKPENLVFYFPQENTPVVLFFDAQAAGSQFISRFKDLFTSLNIGVIASNQYRNGISSEKASQIVQQMLNLAKQQNADMSQIYLMGFSGGGRFVQQLGGSLPNVKAIITFGIGKRERKPGKIPEINLIGIDDVNFSEALIYPIHGNYVYPDLVFVHEGGHEWPKIDVLKYALSFSTSICDVNSMKKPEQKDILVRKLNKTLQSFEMKGLETSQKQLRALIGDQIQKEQNWLRRFQSILQSQDLEVWQTMISKLENEEADEHIRARVKGYLSMVNYLLADRYVIGREFISAEGQLRVYELVDSSNPDIDLLKAQNYANQGKFGKAIDHIDLAITKGFDNYQKLLYTKFPDELIKREDFVLTLSKIYSD